MKDHKKTVITLHATSYKGCQVNKNLITRNYLKFMPLSINLKSKLLDLFKTCKLVYRREKNLKHTQICPKKILQNKVTVLLSFFSF